MEEIELKFLGINSQETEKKLITLGAKFVFEKLYRRVIFDNADFSLDAQRITIRLRDEGEKIMLAYKKSIKDQKTEEIEVEVNDFDNTALILKGAGLEEKHYIENRRKRYILDGVEFDVDEWPLVGKYLEIEAPSWDKLSEGASKLGLNSEDGKILNVSDIYALKNLKLLDYSVLTFDKQVKR